MALAHKVYTDFDTIAKLNLLSRIRGLTPALFHLASYFVL